MSAPDANHFEHLPDELVEHILYSTAYEGPEFRPNSFEYQDSTTRGSPFSGRHSDFALKCVVTCKRFLRIGVPLLWRFVVVRSPSSLEHLYLQARTGGSFFPTNSLPLNTRRLQLRVCSPLDPDLVQKFVQLMPRLTIFVSNNTRSPIQRCPHTTPSSLSVTLSQLPLLRRVLFCSINDAQCYCDVRALLQTKAPLSTIRIESLDSPPTPTPLNAINIANVTDNLLQISFGLTIAEGRDMLAGPGVDLVLAGLTDHAVVLPNLRKAHMLQYSSFNIPFLQRHGAGLRELLYSTPPHEDEHHHYPPFISLCPNLRVLIWVIAEWEHVRGAHAFPARHATLNALTIVYPERDPPSPQAHEDVQRVLALVESGSFPNLKIINLKPGGSSDPNLESLTWFRAQRRSLKRKGACLRGFTPLR